MTLQAPPPSLFECNTLALTFGEREGRLILSCAPGRTEALGVRGSRERTVEDAAFLREEGGAEVLVCLLQEHEMAYLVDLPGAAAEAGLEFRHIPIPDGSVPLETFDYAREALRIAKELSEGRSVAIHCWAGMGRTGTLGATVLQACGLAPQEALRTVRRARPGTVANALQEAFLVHVPEALEEVRATKARLREETSGPRSVDHMTPAELRDELLEARRLLRELTNLMRR